MDGWIEVKAGLRVAYNIQKVKKYSKNNVPSELAPPKRYFSVTEGGSRIIKYPDRELSIIALLLFSHCKISHQLISIKINTALNVILSVYLL